jgi:hypothetical protein
MQPARFLTGQGSDGLLWASFDELAHHLQGRVCERRFAAYCAPYKSEDEARQALIAAGAKNIEAETGRKRRGR